MSRGSLWSVLLMSWMLLSSACGSEREQALALLDHVNAIDVSAAPAQRMPRLTALESLKLGEPALMQMQQLCASAHRALIDAEVEQAKARHSLDTTKVGETAEARLDFAKTIAAAIERSTLKLQQAQAAFPECERQTRELSLRFPQQGH